MRNAIAVTLTAFVISGCSLLSSINPMYFNMARFDNNEYMLAVEVRSQANLGARKCGTPEVNDEVSILWAKSLILKNYSASIPNNEETVTMTSELLEIVRGLDKRYNIDQKKTSMAYCTNKFGNIEKNATIITNVVGNKPHRR